MRVRRRDLEASRGFGRDRQENRIDWKAISNSVLLVGLFVAMLTMFNQVNGRLDTMQTENNRRFDEMQAEMNRRFDTLQAENQRQHDAMQEVLRVFEVRITRLEEKAGVDPGTAE